MDVISVILPSRARRPPLDETFYRRVHIVDFEISDETAEDCAGGHRKGKEGRRKYGEARDIPVDLSGLRLLNRKAKTRGFGFSIDLRTTSRAPKKLTTM